MNPLSPSRLAGLAFLLSLSSCSRPDPVERGVRALEEGRPQEAFRLLRRAAEEDPASGEAQLHLARVCLLTLRTSVGVEAAKRALDLRPEDPRAHLVKAWLDQRRSLNLLARDRVAEAVQLEPGVARYHVARGEILIGSGRLGTPDYESAETEFREALRLEPGSLRARFGLAKTLVLGDRHGEGERELDALLETGFEFGEALYLRGLARMRRRELAGAESDYRRAILLGADTAALYFNLSRVLNRTGRREEAEQARIRYEALRKADDYIGGLLLSYHLESLDIRIAIELGRSLLETRRPQDALGILESVCADHPSLPRAQLLLGRAALEAGRLETAARAAERALEIVPDHAPAHHLAARVESARGRPDRALPSAREAVRLDPARLDYLVMLAGLLVETGKAGEAERVLDEAEKLAPGNPRVEAGRGSALLAAGLAAEGEGLLTSALAKRPRRYRWLHERGSARLAQGKLTLAEDDFRRAIALAPHFPAPYEGLARVLRERGAEVEAEAAARDHRKMLRREKEIRQLREEVGAYPSDLGQATRLASLLAEVGRFAEAGRLRARALSWEAGP